MCRWIRSHILVYNYIYYHVNNCIVISRKPLNVLATVKDCWTGREYVVGELCVSEVEQYFRWTLELIPSTGSDSMAPEWSLSPGLEEWLGCTLASPKVWHVWKSGDQGWNFGAFLSPSPTVSDASDGKSWQILLLRQEPPQALPYMALSHPYCPVSCSSSLLFHRHEVLCITILSKVLRPSVEISRSPKRIFGSKCFSRMSQLTQEFYHRLVSFLRIDISSEWEVHRVLPTTDHWLTCRKKATFERKLFARILYL